jgi:hypothetical protein
VTATVTASPAAGEVRLVGEIEYVHGAPVCVTPKVWPAIVTEPVRCEVDVLAATVTVALPLPVPLAPDVIESQLVELLAVHVQLLPAVTATVTASPAAGEVRLVGDIEYVHGAAPACVTLNEMPAIVIVAARGDVEVFAVAEKFTAPLPLPFDPDVIVSHDAGLDADHVQPVATSTLTEPFDAAAASDALPLDSAGAQVGVNENEFDSALGLMPPGPTAATRDSYCTPPASGEVSRATKSKRIMPSVCGAGLPRSMDCTICVLPTVKICIVYEETRGVPSLAVAL